MDPFTHLFLESTLIWIIFGVVGAQGEFLSSMPRRLSFGVVMFGAIAADFDVLIPGAHRLFTHSLVLALVVFLVGVGFWATKQARIFYLISWGVSFQLVMHILLDLGSFPPMGLFWPISPLVYNVGIAIVDTGGGLPQVLFYLLVFTPHEWLTWGKTIFSDPQWTLQLGVPLLAFLLFLFTIGRDFWPWWKPKELSSGK